MYFQESDGKYVSGLTIEGKGLGKMMENQPVVGGS